MKQLIKIFACTLVLTNSQFIFAEITGYEVEVIIFSYNNNPYLNSENWPETKPATTTPLENINQINNEETSINNQPETSSTKEPIPNSEMAQISSPVDLTKQPIFLNTNQYRLTTQAQKIQSQKSYKLLFHKAWKQAGLPENQAFPIHIDSSLENTDTVVIQSQTVTDDTPNIDEYIQGNITLIMSRYLHIQANLVLHKAVPVKNVDKSEHPESPVSLTQAKKYNINLERRMKSREIHFIDHPLIGILILATPFKISEPSDEENPTHKYKTIE